MIVTKKLNNISEDSDAVAIGRFTERLQALAANQDLPVRNEWHGVDVEDLARALVLVESMSVRMNEVVFTPLQKELLGAIRAPAPPLQRIMSQLETIRMPGPIEAAALGCFASEKEDSNATHPPLRQRLTNVGFTEVPKVDAPQMSAADALLSDQAFKDLVTRLDGQWTRRAAESVDIYQ